MPPRGPRRVVRRAVQVTVPLVAVGAAFAAASLAHAEGPGYGGSADRLSVTWGPASTAPTAPLPGSAATTQTTTGGGRGTSVVMPASDLSSPGLQVTGVGFRGLSSVSVRIGDAATFSARADDTGTLAVSIVPASADATSVGTSVVAIGRAPSGTSKTLIGSVPPQPTSSGPIDAVPWITVVVLVGLTGSSVARRLRDTQSVSLARP